LFNFQDKILLLSFKKTVMSNRKMDTDWKADIKSSYILQLTKFLTYSFYVYDFSGSTSAE
jgi:hypothetical protein